MTANVISFEMEIAENCQDSIPSGSEDFQRP
jgi:hypothetical protein